LTHSFRTGILHSRRRTRISFSAPVQAVAHAVADLVAHAFSYAEPVEHADPVAHA
jgi:hypothetical protein